MHAYVLAISNLIAIYTCIACIYPFSTSFYVHFPKFKSEN